MADLSQQIEVFLRNALRQRKLEDRLIRQALRDLRVTLTAVERVVGSSGVLAVGPNRERTIASITAAVARSVQESFGAPQLAALQEALSPFVEQQLEYARRLVTMAGGSLTAEGAGQLSQVQVQRLVNDAVVGGKTLSAQLTQALPAVVADRVERYIRLGLSDIGGETFATYENAVVRVSENNVEAIVRTAVNEVGSAAQQAIYQYETDPDWLGAEGLVWTALLDSQVCPICLKLDGKRFPPDYQKVSPHMQCVLGDTEIEPGIIAAAMRSHYTGNVVTIRTDGNRMLSVTENHPVLTCNGWKPAKLLQEGDQLISRQVKRAPVINPELDQRPVTAEQLFTLLAEKSLMKGRCVPAAAMDFHGDGAGMHGNVDIACVNWELLLNAEAVCPQHLRDALFVVADAQLAAVDDLGPLDALLLAMHAAATGFIGGGDLIAALLGGHLAPLEGFSLALAARRDPGFDEPLAYALPGHSKLNSDLVLAYAGAVEVDHSGVVNDLEIGTQGHAGTEQAVANRFATDAKLLRELVSANPAEVAFDHIVSVEIEARHSVPVYDFSTVSGAYFASDILTHNCRCSLVPWKWRNEEMTDPNGNPVAPRRLADGDGAEQPLDFKVAAKQWVKDNPQTAQAIFGKKLGQRLVDGEISFDKAVKQWSSPKAS